MMKAHEKIYHTKIIFGGIQNMSLLFLESLKRMIVEFNSSIFFFCGRINQKEVRY